MTKTPNLAAAVLCASIAAPAAGDEALFGEIDAANRAFAKAIVAGDVDHLVGDYTEDACVIAPSTPRTCGTEAIRAFWTGVVASAPRDVRITTLAADGEGALAHATGTLEITDADGGVHLNQFVLVLKRVDGTWKLHLDTWTPR